MKIKEKEKMESLLRRRKKRKNISTNILEKRTNLVMREVVNMRDKRETTMRTVTCRNTVC